MFLFTTVVFEESLEKRPLVRHVEEEKEEDAKTQRIILYVCVCVYIYIRVQSQIHRKQRAPKRRTKERI